jgi:hypothetical protein
MLWDTSCSLSPQLVIVESLRKLKAEQLSLPVYVHFSKPNLLL